MTWRGTLAPRQELTAHISQHTTFKDGRVWRTESSDSTSRGRARPGRPRGYCRRAGGPAAGAAPTARRPLLAVGVVPVPRAARFPRPMQPTPEQIEAYRRDGFLVVEDWLDAAEVERAREHFARCFAHEWETGLMPDEVNYDPATTPPDRTRQLCNVWKADRALAATVLSPRIGELRRGARRRAGPAPDPGQRDLEAAVGQGAAVPPGRRVPGLPGARRT